MSTEITEKKDDITLQVLSRIESMKSAGQIVIPKDYEPANALRSAQLLLSEATMKDDKGQIVKVLDYCTKTSIAQSLLKMVVDGLSVAKNQCYLIPYKNELQYQKSYFGNIALAKRVAGVTKVVAHVIYDGDKFDYGVDLDTGYLSIFEHKPSFKNRDNDKIIGGYAIVFFSDGTKKVELMTMAEITQAWKQSYSFGKSSTHKDFKQEMAKKTIINRALKDVINTSNDEYLTSEDVEESEQIYDTIDANFQEVQEIEVQVIGQKKENKTVLKEKEVKESSFNEDVNIFAPIK